ncbi:MAG: hypothetical protein AABY00_01455 [Nanoarchaeota archaeon]
MIETSNIDQAKKLLKTESAPKIVKAVDDAFNRKILEYGKFDILLSVESGDHQDTLRSINSGFNEVLARIAAKNNISLGIDFEEIKALDKKQKAQRLSKIRQNIRLCRKAGVKLALLHVRDRRDAESFLVAIGASTKQLKESS